MRIATAATLAAMVVLSSPGYAQDPQELPCWEGSSYRWFLRWRATQPEGPGDSTAPAGGWRLFKRRPPATEWEEPPMELTSGSVTPGATITEAVFLDPRFEWHLAIQAYGPGGQSGLSNHLRVPPVVRSCTRPGTPELLDVFSALEGSAAIPDELLEKAPEEQQQQPQMSMEPQQEQAQPPQQQQSPTRNPQMQQRPVPAASFSSPFPQQPQQQQVVPLPLYYPKDSPSNLPKVQQ